MDLIEIDKNSSNRVKIEIKTLQNEQNVKAFKKIISFLNDFLLKVTRKNIAYLQGNKTVKNK